MQELSDFDKLTNKRVHINRKISSLPNINPLYNNLLNHQSSTNSQHKLLHSSLNQCSYGRNVIVEDDLQNPGAKKFVCEPFPICSNIDSSYMKYYKDENFNEEIDFCSTCEFDPENPEVIYYGKTNFNCTHDGKIYEMNTPIPLKCDTADTCQSCLKQIISGDCSKICGLGQEDGNVSEQLETYNFKTENRQPCTINGELFSRNDDNNYVLNHDNEQKHEITSNCGDCPQCEINFINGNSDCQDRNCTEKQVKKYIVEKPTFNDLQYDCKINFKDYQIFNDDPTLNAYSDDYDLTDTSIFPKDNEYLRNKHNFKLFIPCITDSIDPCNECQIEFSDYDPIKSTWCSNTYFIENDLTVNSNLTGSVPCKHTISSEKKILVTDPNYQYSNISLMNQYTHCDLCDYDNLYYSNGEDNQLTQVPSQITDKHLDNYWNNFETNYNMCKKSGEYEYLKKDSTLINYPCKKSISDDITQAKFIDDTETKSNLLDCESCDIPENYELYTTNDDNNTIHTTWLNINDNCGITTNFKVKATKRCIYNDEYFNTGEVVTDLIKSDLFECHNCFLNTVNRTSTNSRNGNYNNENYQYSTKEDNATNYSSWEYPGNNVNHSHYSYCSDTNNFKVNAKKRCIYDGNYFNTGNKITNSSGNNILFRLTNPDCEPCDNHYDEVLNNDTSTTYNSWNTNDRCNESETFIKKTNRICLDSSQKRQSDITYGSTYTKYASSCPDCSGHHTSSGLGCTCDSTASYNAKKATRKCMYGSSTIPNNQNYDSRTCSQHQGCPDCGFDTNNTGNCVCGETTQQIYKTVNSTSLSPDGKCKEGTTIHSKGDKIDTGYCSDIDGCDRTCTFNSEDTSDCPCGPTTNYKYQTPTNAPCKDGSTPYLSNTSRKDSTQCTNTDGCESCIDDNNYEFTGNECGCGSPSIIYEKRATNNCEADGVYIQMGEEFHDVQCSDSDLDCQSLHEKSTTIGAIVSGKVRFIDNGEISPFYLNMNGRVLNVTNSESKKLTFVRLNTGPGDGLLNGTSLSWRGYSGSIPQYENIRDKPNTFKYGIYVDDDPEHDNCCNNEGYEATGGEWIKNSNRYDNIPKKQNCSKLICNHSVSFCSANAQNQKVQCKYPRIREYEEFFIEKLSGSDVPSSLNSNKHYYKIYSARYRNLCRANLSVNPKTFICNQSGNSPNGSIITIEF